jgi:ketosteroid isomerase-like protein
MKRLFFIVIAALILSPAVPAQKAAAAKADPTKPVREAFDRLVDGIKQVDAVKVMDAYEKSDRLLIFNNNGTATLGWDTVKSNVESSYAKLTNVSLEITGLRVEMLGTRAAYVSCKWKQSQENDGKLETAAGRMTLVYKLVGKDWKITHRHTSPDRPDATRPVFPSERQP